MNVLKKSWPFMGLALFMAGAAQAGVTPDEAAKLKTVLTPSGAEKAGNSTGEIPAWTGGMAYQPQLATAKTVSDPHAGDHKVLTIDASNADKYAARLSPGMLQMLKTFPGFHMDIYPTHRDAAWPDYRNQNTFLNATRASLKDHFPIQAYAGYPFPIPKNGEEIAWNSNYQFRGYAVTSMNSGYLVPAGRSPILTSKFLSFKQADVDNPSGNYDSWNGLSFVTVSRYTAPPARAGEMLLAWDDGTSGKQPYSVWQYLVGQRRVRKAPNIKYDGTYPDCSGFAGSDEIEVWNGDTDRYDMKLIGKKEMYIPYDNNGLYNTTPAEAYGPNFINPDVLRWELHRVWVVDFQVAPGFRHSIPHRTVYFDEDTYGAALADEYNAAGTLFRENIGFSYGQPGFPALFFQPNVVYDLHGGGYCTLSMFHFKDGDQGFQLTPPRPMSAWQPDMLAAESAR